MQVSKTDFRHHVLQFWGKTVVILLVLVYPFYSLKSFQNNINKSTTLNQVLFFVSVGLFVLIYNFGLESIEYREPT